MYKEDFRFPDCLEDAGLRSVYSAPDAAARTWGAEGFCLLSCALVSEGVMVRTKAGLPLNGSEISFRNTSDSGVAAANWAP